LTKIKPPGWAVPRVEGWEILERCKIGVVKSIKDEFLMEDQDKSTWKNGQKGIQLIY
jgi:hypothetical protein